MLQRLTGAESIRQLPTLTLFKINMNLEMEGGTDALAATVEAIPPRELERQPYDETDVAVIRALQGPMAVVDRPYDEAAAEVGMSTDDFLDHLRAMVDRKLLRRVAAILFHRRAGFSANGMGVWKVARPTSPDTGGRMAAVRGISHCYQRPTYEDWPYSVFTMAHGRSKEECDAVLAVDRRRARAPRRGSRGALLLDRVQEDPPALLHPRLRAVGARACSGAVRASGKWRVASSKARLEDVQIG